MCEASWLQGQNAMVQCELRELDSRAWRLRKTALPLTLVTEQIPSFQINYKHRYAGLSFVLHRVSHVSASQADVMGVCLAQ